MPGHHPSQLQRPRRDPPLSPTAMSTPLSAALKRRRVAEAKEGEYVNTYTRANLLRAEYVEAAEAKDGVIEEQRKSILELKQKVNVLEGEKAAAQAKCMRLEQVRQTEDLAERARSEWEASADQDGASRAAVHEESMRVSREREAKLRKLLEVKDARIADLVRSVDSLEEAKAGEREERRSLSGEVERLKDQVLALERAREGTGAIERSALSLEAQLDALRAVQSESEARLGKMAQEAEVERAKANAAEKTILSLQRKLLEASSSSSNPKMADLEVQLSHLQKELEVQATEISTARAIKGRLESDRVLKEKLSQALLRAQRAEAQLTSASVSDVDKESDQRDLRLWKTVVGSKLGNDVTPHGVVQKVEDLEASVLRLTSESGRARAEANQAGRARTDLETRTGSLMADQRALQATVDDLKAASLRHERKITLLHKEREGLKRIIASFDQEEVSLKPEADPAAAKSALRVHELEQMLEREKALVKNLESDIQTLNSKKSEAQSPGQEASHRILHMRHNPVERGLSERIRALEAEISALKSARPGQEAAAAPQVETLRKRVEELSKKESRLKAAFQERVSLFIDACYAIFGYRIDMTTSDGGAKFLLRPMHEEKESLFLSFALSDGKAELVPTEYSETMQREVDTFIGRYKTVPAFTANLTMDIFNKQTQC